MNTQAMQVIMVRGVIAGLPKEDQEKAEACYLELKEIVDRHGNYGIMALALIGAEVAARGDNADV